MKLKELIKDIENYEIVGKGYKDIDISMISNDSRMVQKKGLFIAITGYKDSGIKYIDDAIKRGAVAIILGKEYKKEIKTVEGIIYIFVNNPRYANLLVARSFYDYPHNFLKIIGVTGTNGKTTITYIIESILKEAGYNVGVIGTINYRYNDNVIKANNTTPDAIEIQKMLREMVNNKVQYVVMEVSSHALYLDRVMSEDYEYAIFTNLSQDHLDFHKNMEDYFQAKLKLFKGLKKEAGAIINIDDDYGRRIPEYTEARIIGYGIVMNADIRGRITSLSVNGTNFTINGKNYHTTLVGEHNVYNILASYGVARDIGIDDDLIKDVISGLKPVPGRFDRVENKKGYKVFVDYAHTPDALEHLLLAANSIKKSRIITVFGCGGDRDRGKRPLMGKVVEELSDVAIVTSDNPRTEDPMAIIEDIKKGLDKNNHLIIPDRKEAIYKAIEMADEDDIVLIAGKGHEDYQILKDRVIHFDDKEVALKAIEEIG